MPKVTAQEKLAEFLIEFAADECSRELLQLLGRHPYARLSWLSIVHALDWRKTDIQRSLNYLIERDMVKVRTENGLSLYRLTEAEPVNSLVQGLAALDWSQWHRMVSRISGRLNQEKAGLRTTA